MACRFVARDLPYCKTSSAPVSGSHLLVRPGQRADNQGRQRGRHSTMPLRESRLKRYAVSQGFAGQWIGIAAGSMRSPRAYQAFALMGTEYGGQRTRISIDARVVLRRYREPQIAAFYKRQNSNDSAICVVGQRTRQPIDARVVLRYRCTTRANPSKSCVVQRMRLGEPRFRGPANNRRAQPADKPFLSPRKRKWLPSHRGEPLTRLVRRAYITLRSGRGTSCTCDQNHTGTARSWTCRGTYGRRTTGSSAPRSSGACWRVPCLRHG